MPFLTLALSDSKAKPYGAVVLFDMDEDWNLYFFGDEFAHKHALVLQNPQFSATAYAIGDVYVQMTGRVETIENVRQYEQELVRLSHKAATVEHFWPPLLDLRRGDYVLYKLIPEWIRAMPLSDRPKGQFEPRFLEIKRPHAMPTPKKRNAKQSRTKE